MPHTDEIIIASIATDINNWEQVRQQYLEATGFQAYVSDKYALYYVASHESLETLEAVGAYTIYTQPGGVLPSLASDVSQPEGAPQPSDTAPAPLPLPGTAAVGDAVIPTGMRLIRITDPAGTDADELYFVVGDVFGVEVAYEVGDLASLNAMFGSADKFGSVTTISQAQFDASDIFVVGLIDEITGATGSLQAQYERDMRALGLESPPVWMREDRSAMAMFVTAANEGWSPERTWNALSGLDAFQRRFPGLDVVQEQLGTASFVEGLTEYVRRESDIRGLILSSRGPAADVSQQYVSSLIASGWTTGEVGELLGLEKRVRGGAVAIDNINEILTFQGIDALSPDDFISFLQDQDNLTVDPSFTPGEIFEAINDALRLQALLTEGLDIDLGFATELGTGISEEILTVEQFSRQAQLAAGFIAANIAEIDMAKMGLERDDIIAATFGEARKGGKAVSEVNRILEQFARERSKAAQGFAGSQTFIDAAGRLRTQGFAAFS